MSILGQASVVAHSSYLMAFICLLATGWGNFAHKDQTDNPSLQELIEQRMREMQPEPSQIPGMPMVFYLFVFSLAGTSVLPSVLSNMQDRRQFGRVLYTSYFIAVTVYFIVGLCSYVLFGPHTAQLFTANVGTDIWSGADLQGSTFLKQIASAMVMCKLLLCIPVLAYPIFSDVKKMLAQQSSTRGLVSCRWQIFRYLWRAPFLACMGAVAALFGNHVALAVSVVGALFGTPLICFLPVAVYVGLSRRLGKPIGFWKYSELVVIVLLGSVVGCMALIDCWIQLNQGASKEVFQSLLKDSETTIMVYWHEFQTMWCVAVSSMLGL